MIYIESPNRNFIKNKKSLFLAGGITKCPNWQADVLKELKDSDIIVFNPRRENFPIDNPNAAFDQIKWEHDMFRKSDMISFWFCAETMCPIVLYELGAWSMTNIPIIIGMDPKYPRRQDVEIQTKLVRSDIKIVYTMKDFTDGILQMVGQSSTPEYMNSQIFRSAVRLAKQKKDDYYTGGFDIMKKLFKKQHKKQNIRHGAIPQRKTPTSKLQWESRYEHERDVQAAWCESEGLPVPKEENYLEL